MFKSARLEFWWQQTSLRFKNDNFRKLFCLFKNPPHSWNVQMGRIHRSSNLTLSDKLKRYSIWIFFPSSVRLCFSLSDDFCPHRKQTVRHKQKNLELLLSFPAFHLWSQFTNFWFPYWSRARRGPAELGNPDAAAIRGLRDARSSCQSGRAEPRSLRTKPPARPGRDSYEAKLEIIQRPASSGPSWQGAQRGTNKSSRKPLQ